MRPLILLACCLMLSSPAIYATPWSDVSTPFSGAPRVIGATNNGCIAGAAALPSQGEGYAVMHLERRRYFGHPLLIDTLENLSRQAARHGIGPILIGDLGQARGGPMPSGHRSHQTGLDVDVWFALDAGLLARADAQRANVSAPSLLNAKQNGLERRLWSHKHAELLRLAAEQPAVDRIFVNPYIKKELCASTRGARHWLRKIRPWYRHDDHFHLRLTCPVDNPNCEVQETIPAGEGCDASLDWWFQPHPPSVSAPSEAPTLPSACAALLTPE